MNMIYGHNWSELFPHYEIGVERNGHAISFQPVGGWCPCAMMCVRLGIQTIGM